MDRPTHYISNYNGITDVCNCFRGTCEVCAPYYKRNATPKRKCKEDTGKTEEGERNNE